MSDLLQVRDLTVTRGRRDVLCGVTLGVDRGEICALMGVSGAGKSTALRAVAGLEPFTAGSITVGDARLSAGPLPRESSLAALRRQVGMVFQGHSLFDHLTIIENVTLAPLHVHRWPPERAYDMAHNLLRTLGVADRADAFPRQVSGGEAQRVAIARALVTGPALLLMDEPTSALDPARRTRLGETLRGLAREGRGLLVATHDVEFARLYADRVVVLAAGTVAETGRAPQVLGQPSERATRALLQAETEDKEQL